MPLMKIEIVHMFLPLMKKAKTSISLAIISTYSAPLPPRKGVLSGKTIVIVYLISEPELYFYLTLAEVRQIRHSIDTVS